MYVDYMGEGLDVYLSLRDWNLMSLSLTFMGLAQKLRHYFTQILLLG